MLGVTTAFYGIRRRKAKGFSAMANHLPRERQIQALNMLVEGASLRTVTRLTGIHRTTVMKLMVKFGEWTRDFLDLNLSNLSVRNVEVDELWTFCRKKQKRLRGTICTSHIERQNLTIRTFMRRFTRLTVGFSKKLENLAAATALYVAYYNFCWRTRMPGTSGQKRPTAAMMAGLTESLWDFERLFDEVTEHAARQKRAANVKRLLRKLRSE